MSARHGPPSAAPEARPTRDPAAPEYLRALRSADGLFVTDGRQRIVSWSDSAQRILGHAAHEVLGRPCYEVMAGSEPNGHPVCRRNCRVAANARRGRVTAAYDVVAHTRGAGRAYLTNSVVLAGEQGGTPPYLLHLFRAHGPRVDERDDVTPVELPPGTPDPASVPAVVQPLSRRELEVLRLLVGGLSTAEIAQALTISRFTARNHVNNLERKLGAHNRVEVVVLATYHRLI